MAIDIPSGALGRGGIQWFTQDPVAAAKVARGERQAKALGMLGAGLKRGVTNYMKGGLRGVIDPQYAEEQEQVATAARGEAEAALGRAHITCNKNGIPFDPEKPMVTSGIRLGTPACTTRGFGIAEFRQVGDMIVEVLDVLSQKHVEEDSLVEGAVRDKVKTLIGRFPIYQD